MNFENRPPSPNLQENQGEYYEAGMSTNASNKPSLAKRALGALSALAISGMPIATTSCESDPIIKKTTPPSESVESGAVSDNHEDAGGFEISINMNSMGSAESAQNKNSDNNMTSSSESTESVDLSKFGITDKDIKSEFLKKFQEGKYEALAVIDLSDQTINLFDSNGIKIIDSGNISSGREGMETPTGSYESGASHEDYINNEGDDMPFAVNINSNRGIFIHQGSLPGVPSSHGCIRVNRENAKKVYDIAKRSKGNMLVVVKN